jgi:hypothetical protein
MGAATSIQSTDIITKAVGEVASSIVQTAVSTSDQSVVIRAEDVQGNVLISNNNIEQRAYVSTNAIFKALNSQENSVKVKDQLEALTKSIISGLNIGQISVSTSTVSSIVENCIKMTTEGISECSNKASQTISVTAKKVSGNVEISNLNIKQVVDSVSQCLLDSVSNTNLATETDRKISQITETSAEGFDSKYLILAGAVVLCVMGVTSAKSITKLIGPIMLIAGIITGYMGYTQSQELQNIKTDNSFVYIRNALSATPNTGNLQFIKNEPFGGTQDNAALHGDADVYETFNGTITLYRNGDANRIKSIRNDVLSENIKNTVDGNKITISISNSTKYPPKVYTIPVSTIYGVYVGDNVNALIPNTVYLITKDFDYLHKIDIKYTNQTANKSIDLDTYVLEPTILSFKKTQTAADLFKEPLVLSGAALVVLGLVVFMTSTLAAAGGGGGARK